MNDIAFDALQALEELGLRLSQIYDVFYLILAELDREGYRKANDREPRIAASFTRRFPVYASALWLLFEQIADLSRTADRRRAAIQSAFCSANRKPETTLEVPL